MEIGAAVGSFAALAVTGAQIFSKLSTLAFQIRSAREQILLIAQEVSGVEAAIQQLTDLLNNEEFPQSVDPDNKSLHLIGNLRTSCQGLFESIETGLKAASKQIKAKGLPLGSDITLSPSEQALWPFRHDKVTWLLRELSAVKTTLMLVSQMTTLSLVKRLTIGFVTLSHKSLFV